MTRRPEGWRTLRSMAATAGTPPTGADVAAPAGIAAPAGGPLRAPRAALRAIGEYLIALRSRVGAVQWTLTLVGLLLYVFTTTTYRLPLGDVGMGLALFGLLLQASSFRFPAAAMIYVLFLVWAVIGAVASPYQAATLTPLLDAAKVGLIMLAVINGLRGRAHVWFYMVFYLACFGSHPARGTIFNYLGGYTKFGRAMWNNIYANSNDMAALTLLALSMAAALAMTERKGIVRLGAIGAMFVFPVVILMTQSRAVFVGLALFVVLAILGHRRKGRSLLILALISVVVVAVSPKGVWERVRGLGNAATGNFRAVDAEGSAEQRMEIWRTGAKIVKAHPITGVGIGAYSYANGDVSAILGKKDAHSTYLTLAAENGFIGLGLFLAMIWATIARSRRVRRRCRDSIPMGALQLRYLELGLICFLVAGIWGSYGKLAFLYIHIALIWSLAAACEQEDAHARQLVVSGRAPARI